MATGEDARETIFISDSEDSLERLSKPTKINIQISVITGFLFLNSDSSKSEIVISDRSEDIELVCDSSEDRKPSIM